MKSTKFSQDIQNFFEEEASDAVGSFGEQLASSISAFRITSLAGQTCRQCIRAIPTHSNATINSFVSVRILSTTRDTLFRLIEEEGGSVVARQAGNGEDDEDARLSQLKRRQPKGPNTPIDDDAIQESSGYYLKNQTDLDAQIAAGGALNGNATNEDIAKNFNEYVGYDDPFKKGPLPSEVFRNAISNLCMAIIADCTSKDRLAPILDAGLASQESIASLTKQIIELFDRISPPSDAE